MTSRRTLKRYGIKVNSRERKRVTSGPVSDKVPLKNPIVRTETGKVRYSEKESKYLINLYHLREYVRKMRPYFGDIFKASAGFDLRRVSSWTPAQQRKVKKYWYTIAPLISKTFKPHFYRNTKNLKAAISYTQQEKFLKGQRAALFPSNDREQMTVKVRSGAVRVMRGARGGTAEVKVTFDSRAMIRDPIAEARRVIAAKLPGAKIFKLMQGPHLSRGIYRNLDEVLTRVAQLESKYQEHDQGDPFNHYYGDWLTGVVGYYGRKESVASNLLQAGKLRDVEIRERKKKEFDKREQIRLALIKRAQADKLKAEKARIRARLTRKVFVVLFNGQRVRTFGTREGAQRYIDKYLERGGGLIDAADFAIKEEWHRAKKN